MTTPSPRTAPAPAQTAGEGIYAARHPRYSRRTLTLALAGCWLTTALAAAVVVAVELGGDDRLGVFVVAIYPLYLGSAWPICADLFRNPRLSNPIALLWVYAVLYLPAAGATAYWHLHAPKPGKAPDRARDRSRLSRRSSQGLLYASMAYVLVVVGGFLVYILLGAVGLIEA